MLARTDDMRDALVWLNGRIRRFRYTAIFEFDGRDLHTILLYDRNLGTFTTSGVMPVAASYCDYVRAFERSLWIADSVVDARVAVDHPKRDVFKAYCGAPLRDGTGRIYGTLCHFDPSAASLRHEDAAALIAAAAIVGPRFAAGSTAGLVGALAAAIDVPDGSQSRADELAALVASAFDGITTFDRDGNVRLVNEAAISHFGSTRDELAASWRGLLRNAASDHVDPDDRDPVTRALRGEAVTVSASIAGRLITLTASPVRDDCDAITGALLITQDMTDTARLTSQVREHARMLELDAEVGRALATAGELSDVLRDAADVVVRILDAACVRVWTLDDTSEGLTLVASAGCDTRLDGANARVPVEALEIDRIAANREPLLTNDLATEQEWAGREAMVAFAGYPLVVGGRLVGVIAMFARRTLSVAVLTAMRVIATGMAQTVERHRAEQRCAASQNLLVTTLASIGDAVISVDSERCVTYVNAMAANLTGWTLDEARGRLLAEVFALVHEATGAPLSNLVDVVLEGGRVVTGANHAMLQRRDGTLLPIENSAAPIRVGDGPVLGVVLVFRDATQSRAIEHEQQRLLALEQIAHRTADEARAAAEHAIAVKDDFLARVSHDLRNPLGAILAWTALLRDEHTASGRAGKGLKIIEHNARAQVQLIEDLLDVARISSGKLRVKLATVDVAAAIVGALEPTDFAASAKGVSLVRFIDPEIGAIVADPDRFQQILWNLVSNAVKFTPTGGRVTVRAERTGSEVVIEVADTGAGIDPAFLPFVFNKFEQATTSSTRSGGLGLGLAIVHSLVERHGGTIRAESEGLGHGATFTVRLPIHAARQNTDRRNDTGTVPALLRSCPAPLQGEQTKNRR